MIAHYVLLFEQVWETGVTSPLESPRALAGNLPFFSRSPLPYITEVWRRVHAAATEWMLTARLFLSPQIGDYLLTLPQQLEPFTSQDNPALMAALQRGKLPYTSGEILSTELTTIPANIHCARSQDSQRLLR